MRRKKLFTAPHLNDAGGNLSKPWFVEVGYRDPRDGKMKRKRYQEEFTPIRTKKARYELAEKMIKDFTKKLNCGWIPPDDEKIIYVDELQYHEAARIYGRKRKANKNIRFYASEYMKKVKGTKAPKTHKTYQAQIRKFTGWLEKNDLIDNDLSTIEKPLIGKFFDYLILDLKLSRKTIKNYRISLGKFFHHLMEDKLLTEYPIPKIELPEPGEDHSAMQMFDHDMMKLLPAMKREDPQLYLAAMMQYFCFVRPGDELLSLRVKHINFNARTIRIPSNIAKERDSRVVDLPEQLYLLLIEYGIHTFEGEMYVIGRHGRPGPLRLGDNTLASKFRKIRDKLHLNKSYKWYSFKHTGAGKLLASGATIIELMNQLGHTDIESTYRYIKQHFGERSEHVRNKFPTPPGMEKTKNNWMSGLNLN